ncbi:RNA12 protein-domain-containing protein [Annulohypoxylon maeteangense]|uniref:RNA12 protein-domain-containing protein n=1 Tax=Annulohypoxylon maeteangense TaxID=1927788 RepID=UPI002007A91A|nr:RNA12 protein-domain-containing protein [Annulohypoxylon maeteangense]KAI0884677.1 RNA12 protein-domain-containing protein [Annulohypoxylon maeteangense]
MISRFASSCPRNLPGLRTPSSILRSRPIVTPRYQLRWTPALRAWESTTTGEGKSGHIDAAPNESILWIDNLFPLKLSGLLRAPWRGPDEDLSKLMERFESSSLGLLDPINLVKRAIPETAPVKITEILPRLKDGGAFVKFTYPSNVSVQEIETTITKSLKEKPVKPIFSLWRGVQAGLVHGIPWLEDLHRFPNDRLRVEFVPKVPGEQAVELSQETLYSLFRKYGKIAEISSQPWDSKVLPRYSYVDFALVRDAIMARNCLHGFIVPENLGGGKLGTKLQMSYEQRTKPHRFWEWISSHPRIVIPVVVALLTGLTVIIFDPIRSFFVKAHVTQKYRLSNSRVYRWLRQRTFDILSLKKEKADQAGLNALWTHRKDLIDEIQKWLLETTGTFIVVQGPRGSGKEELVLDQALKGRSNVLVIDCKKIVEARGESATIKNMAASVGYRPIFSWANNVSSMVELAVQSTTGVKAGFSETLESQIQKILQTTASALTEIGVSNRSKNDSDASLAVDAYLEAHAERRPIVVIDNFLHKGDANTIVYEKIAEWAAALVQSNIAHVIFLTNDTSYSKSLSKFLPDRIFRQAALGDLSPDVSKRFILSHINNDDDQPKKEDTNEPTEKSPLIQPDLTDLDASIDILGGRLTDLESLARRLKAGQSPKQAVAEITEQSASEILKMFLLPGKATHDGEHAWSVEQAWHLVKSLSATTASDGLRYNEVLLHNTFASSTTAPDGESALEGLANAELITVRSANGRPGCIMPGKPVYQAAFRQLVQDKALAAKMDLAVLTELVKVESKTIDKVEGELALLGALPKQPRETGPRVQYLLSKLEAAQRRIEGFEREIGALKKVLGTEY